MCAINGLNFKDEGLIRKMVESTRHRGPDQEGYFCDEDVSLGSARLSIIDLSERGRQPIWNEDKTVCVILNGEIYNFKELKEDLKKRGHIFYSDTDTEVLVHLYEDHGKKCLDFLNGIFAFAIWDKKRKELFLARDRVGVKPLYYYFNGKNFIFSSEIKAILEHPIKREIETKALGLYFKLRYVPSPLTLFKNILKLPPAHFMTYKNGAISIKRYWDIQDEEEIASYKEALGGIKDIARDSVRRQLVADRPVGIFLSGGIDSTAVLGMANEFSKEKIRTYSVGYDINIESEKYNRDFYLARETAKIYDTDHHELLISDTDARDVFEKVIFHMDEPVSNDIQIATFLLAREAKNDVAVVLGGDGGDELFGGYVRYHYSKLIDRYQILPPFLRQHILPIFLEKLLSKRNLAAKLNTPQTIERYLLFMGEHDEELARILQPDVFDASRVSLRDDFPENKFSDFTKYLMYLDFAMWLPDESLVRSDKMTMAHGIEERVPLLDHRLIELAFKIPTKFKIKSKRENKAIFRHAMREYLPKHVLDNKQKMGWFSPAAKWLRAGMKDFAYDVLSPAYCDDTKEYFNFPEIRKILDNHVSGKEYGLYTLWSLLTFQVWYKKFIKP